MATSNRPLHASYAPSSATAAEVSTCLSDDDVFHLLQTFRRRETIRYLLHENGPVRMRDIAEHVAAEEHGTTVADLTSTQRQRVYIPLYQSHLPKLDEAGVIEYDKARGLVRPTDDLQLFRPSLEAPTIPPSKTGFEGGDSEGHGNQPYYVAALAASVSFLLVFAVGGLPFSGLTLGAIVTALFVLATVLDRTRAIRRVVGRRYR